MLCISKESYLRRKFRNFIFPYTIIKENAQENRTFFCASMIYFS
jgi:hypothetical protein